MPEGNDRARERSSPTTKGVSQGDWRARAAESLSSCTCCPLETDTNTSAERLLCCRQPSRSYAVCAPMTTPGGGGDTAGKHL